MIKKLCRILKRLWRYFTTKEKKTMANDYFEDATYKVTNGTASDEDDINLFSAAVEAAFDSVETDIDTHIAGTTSVHGIVDTSLLLAQGDVDDIPVNGVIIAPISSNWAYDHDADANSHHNESHTVASHNDTTATGTELESLTDDSMVDTLHRHSELSASDGTPNPALSANTTGTLSTYGQLDINGLDKAADKNASLFLYGTGTDLPNNLCSIYRVGGTGGNLVLDNGGGGDIVFNTEGDITSNVASGKIYTWSVNSVSEWTLDSAGFYPTVDGSNSIGTNSNRPGAVWTDQLLITSSPPASASASGTAGQIQWDANYIYVCISANTWKRTAISTW